MTEQPRGQVPGATSPGLLRRVNVEAVLGALRTSDVMTVTELMGRTGLTRSTVLAICEELIADGWALELANQREAGGYVKGRPARRFLFDRHAGCVLGVDFGAATVTAVVADLRGTILARAALACDLYTSSSAERLEAVDRAASSVLAEAALETAAVMSVSVGVPAPVDRGGRISGTEHDFWRLFDIGLPAALFDRYGWRVHFENDANLAAIAERWQGAAREAEDFVALLAGNRYGAGLVEGGRLLHGHRGGAGEMAHLDMVEGVGSTEGIAEVARAWARAAMAANATKTRTLRRLCGNAPDDLTAEMVFRAAAAGDETASDILERLALRVARVIESVSGPLNPALVVICGAVAQSVTVLLPQVQAGVDSLVLLPPRVVTSSLGDAVVALGAVRHALDDVEANYSELVTAARRSSPNPLPASS